MIAVAGSSQAAVPLSNRAKRGAGKAKRGRQLRKVANFTMQSQVAVANSEEFSTMGDRTESESPYDNGHSNGDDRDYQDLFVDAVNGNQPRSQKKAKPGPKSKKSKRSSDMMMEEEEASTPREEETFVRHQEAEFQTMADMMGEELSRGCDETLPDIVAEAELLPHDDEELPQDTPAEEDFQPSVEELPPIVKELLPLVEELPPLVEELPLVEEFPLDEEMPPLVDELPLVEEFPLDEELPLRENTPSLISIEEMPPQSEEEDDPQNLGLVSEPETSLESSQESSCHIEVDEPSASTSAKPAHVSYMSFVSGRRALHSDASIRTYPVSTSHSGNFLPFFRLSPSPGLAGKRKAEQSVDAEPKRSKTEGFFSRITDRLRGRGRVVTSDDDTLDEGIVLDAGDSSGVGKDDVVPANRGWCTLM